MTLKFYYSPGSSALSPHIALEESGLPYEAIPAPIATKQLPDGSDYRKVNPLGYVPYLVLADGTGLREGPAIVQYIADQVPAKKLAPPNGTVARYQLQSWLNFIATEVHQSFIPVNLPTPDEVKRIFKDKIASRLTWVDGELAGKAYLMGDDFTVADGYLFTMATGAVTKLGIDLSSLHNLIAHHHRIAARPAVQAALKAEGLA
jgi:glutathione S-transferase